MVQTSKAGYKQTEIGVIPSDWEVTKLFEVIEANRSIRYGIVQPGKFEPNGCLMLRSQDYSKGWSNGDEMHRVNATLENQYKNARINKEDLIMTVVGAGIGQVVIAPDWLDKAIVSRSTARIAVDKTKAAKEYVLCCLTSPLGVRQILDAQKEGAQPVISCLDLAKFNIPSPNLAEQTAIATALSDADALISSLEKLIAKKRNIKQGAMQKLLQPKEGWEVKKLGDFLDYEQPTEYLVSDTEYNDNNQTPVLTAGKTFILGYTNEEHGIFKKLPVIIFDDFTTAIKYVDFAFKAKSSAMKMLIPKNDKINLRFVYEIMLQIKYQVADHKRHWIGEFSKLEIIVPPTAEEQNAIAAVLSDMDAEINALETKLEKYKKVKLGMMQNLLTGRIRLV